MTVNEFTKKYGIPYNLVYEASWNLPNEKSRASVRYYKLDYDEKELMEAVQGALERRISKHQKLMDKYVKMRDRLVFDI